MRKLIFFFYIIVSVSFLTLVSCDDDDEIVLMSLTALTAGDVDLFSTFNATGVPVDTVFFAEFSHNLNHATVNDSSIVLKRLYDDTYLPLSFESTGNKVTIIPSENLTEGTKYRLVFNNDLLSDEGDVMTITSRNFTTVGTFAPDEIMAYYAFEGNAMDSIGSFNATANDINDITFVDSKNDNSGLAAQFNGTSSIIEIPNGDQFLTNDNFSISFWIKADAAQNGHFVLGLAGPYGFYFEIAEDWKSVSMTTRYQLSNGETVAVENLYNGTGETRDSGGFQGWTVNKDVSTAGGVGEAFFKNLWAHVVFTYNADTKESSIYINSELVKQQDFDLWPEGEPELNITGVTYAGGPAPQNKLALGFIQARGSDAITEPFADFSDPANKQFKGLMDDVKIFSRSLIPNEVRRLYNSEKPQ